MEQAIAAFKNGTCSLIDACRKYKISEKDFRYCLEEDFCNEESGNEMGKQEDYVDNSEKEYLLEGDFLEFEDVLGHDDLMEQDILIEEEYIFEQDQLGNNLKEENIKLETEANEISKSEDLNTPKQWTEEEMQFALHSYKSKARSYNEICADYGISKKEFKKILLSFEKNNSAMKQYLFEENKLNNLNLNEKNNILHIAESNDNSQLKISNGEYIRKWKERNTTKEKLKKRPHSRKNNKEREMAEKKLAIFVGYLQEGMVNVKPSHLRRLGFQLFESFEIAHRFSVQKQEAGKTWLENFLTNNQQLNPPLGKYPLTKDYLLQKTNEHFDALEKICTEHKIDASRVYNIEISKFSERMMLVYCANASGKNIRPMIILKQLEESKSLEKDSEFSDKCFITVTPSGKMTQELFATWLQNFIASIRPNFHQKTVLCLDEFQAKCVYLKSIQIAFNNGIIFVQLPSSGSVRMQPFQMTLMRSMHFEYTKKVEAWFLANAEDYLTLKRSIEILLNVYESVATVKKAIEGFKNAGIWPLNRNSFINLIVRVEDDSKKKVTSEEETEEEEQDQEKEKSKKNKSSERTNTTEKNTDSESREKVQKKKESIVESSLNGFHEVSLEEILKKSLTENGNENEKEKNSDSNLSNKYLNKPKTSIPYMIDEKKIDQVRNTDKIKDSFESSEVVQDFASDIPSVRFCRIHCTACDAHIGSAPSQITNMFEHPKLRTLLCSRCYEFYGDGIFEQGDDQTDMFCRWCANGGNLYCCSFCSNTFCSKCVKRNFDVVIAKKIEDDEKWKCFVCDETDLYSARSLCRAIIQHVQTVSRILQNDKTMTAAEIEEKMRLDESRCCNRKRKRKRRRTGSGSEDEDDESYAPLLNELPQVKRRRTRKSGAYTNGSVNNQSDDESSLLIGENDLLPAMIACEQTMTEGETVLPFGKPAPPTTLPSAVTLTERNEVPPLVYSNNSKINPIPTINLLKPVKVRRLTPVGPISQTPKQMIVQKRPNRPMVSIPQPQAQQKRARVMLPKPRPVTVPETPKIIDLESDSDEAVEVIEESDVPTPSSKAQKNKEDSERIELNEKAFGQLILSQKQDIDQELQTLRKKFSTILSESPEKAQSAPLEDAALKMKQFQQVMRKALYRLAQINDRVVREYQSWKKQQSAEQTENSERTKVDFYPTKNPDVSLEMTCVRDSESESEDNDGEGSVIEASNLEADLLNCYTNLTLFKKKHTVEQGVGNDSVKKEDKSIQVYDVRMRDYEKSVGYSLLMKAEYDPKTAKEVLKPVEVLNEHFGKFQEQYIFHLQYIEENGIKINEDFEDLPDPNETPLKDLIEANSPFIAEMLENIAPTVTNGSAAETKMIVDEVPPRKDNVSEEVSENAHADPTIATSKAVEELVKMVTKLSDELKSSNNSPENSALSPVTEMTDGNEETCKTKTSRKSDESKDEETVIAVRTLIEEESSNDKNFSEPPAETQAMEEECNFLN